MNSLPLNRASALRHCASIGQSPATAYKTVSEIRHSRVVSFLLLHLANKDMLMSEVLGVIIIARNGDRHLLYQDPVTYSVSNTEITVLGEVRLIHFSLLSGQLDW